MPVVKCKCGASISVPKADAHKKIEKCPNCPRKGFKKIDDKPTKSENEFSSELKEVKKVVENKKHKATH